MFKEPKFNPPTTCKDPIYNPSNIYKESKFNLSVTYNYPEYNPPTSHKEPKFNIFTRISRDTTINKIKINKL